MKEEFMPKMTIKLEGLSLAITQSIGAEGSELQKVIDERVKAIDIAGQLHNIICEEVRLEVCKLVRQNCDIRIRGQVYNMVSFIHAMANRKQKARKQRISKRRRYARRR